VPTFSDVEHGSDAGSFFSVETVEDVVVGSAMVFCFKLSCETSESDDDPSDTAETVSASETVGAAGLDELVPILFLTFVQTHNNKRKQICEFGWVFLILASAKKEIYLDGRCCSVSVGIQQYGHLPCCF
jgi:hypothetical protein